MQCFYYCNMDGERKVDGGTYKNKTILKETQEDQALHPGLLCLRAARSMGMQAMLSNPTSTFTQEHQHALPQ